MSNIKKPKSKFPALFTYLVVVLVLAASLALPLTADTFKGNFDFNQSPVMQLGGALSTFGLNLSFGSPLSELYSFKVTFGNIVFDIGAGLLLLYAILCVASLITFITVCCMKKDSIGGRITVAISELDVLTVLLLMIGVNMSKAGLGFNLGVWLPFGITLIMLVVQAIVYFGPSGIMKFVLFAISACAVFFTIAVPANLIPGISSVLQNVASKIGCSPAFFAFEGTHYYAGGVAGLLFTDIKAILGGGNWVLATINFITLAVLLMVCINLYTDMLEIGRWTTTGMLIGSIVKYAIEFALAVALLIVLFTTLGVNGILLYLLIIISFIQLLIAIFRLVAFKRRAVRAAKAAEKKKKEAEEAAKKEAEEAAAKRAEEARKRAEEAANRAASKSSSNYQSRPSSSYQGSSYQSSSYEPAPMAQGETVETRNVVYNVNTIYNGPVDNFIRKLPNEQKVEFARVFLERSNGNIPGIPEYVVGGNNKDFFSKIFVYYSRVREYLSDALMIKLYQEVNSNLQ